MQMQLRHIEICCQLKGYINKMWLFESSGRIPIEDMKLIVPNGMAKLTIPFRNGVSGKNKEFFHLSKESQITLIGIQDIPAIVDIEYDAPHGNIGIEFSPSGTYRIFRLRQSELKNKLFLLEEILGKSARQIQEIIANTQDVNEKIQLIQAYLVKCLSKSEADLILDYCVRQIENSNGSVTIMGLERKTGYSSRWIYEKFMEKVGLSPKTLSSIVRFNQFYKRWAKDPTRDFFKEDMYHYFYDQAHFIKEFKHFTGLSPLKFAKSENEFGRIFYRD
jgi:AraC-like DNA-binding protein